MRYGRDQATRCSRTMSIGSRSTTAEHYRGQFAIFAGPPARPRNWQLNWDSMASAAEARGLFRALLRQSKHFGTSYNVKE